MSQWTDLVELKLDLSQLGSTGVKLLLECSISTIRKVYLGKIKLWDEGADMIGEFTEWQDLEELDLAENQIENLEAKK